MLSLLARARYTPAEQHDLALIPPSSILSDPVSSAQNRGSIEELKQAVQESCEPSSLFDRRGPLLRRLAD